MLVSNPVNFRINCTRIHVITNTSWQNWLKKFMYFFDRHRLATQSRGLSDGPQSSNVVYPVSKIRLIITSRQLKVQFVLWQVVLQFCGSKSSKFLGKSWHIIEQFCDLLSHVLLVTETVCSQSGKEHVQKYMELVDILSIFIPTTENRSLSKISIEGTRKSTHILGSTYNSYEICTTN